MHGLSVLCRCKPFHKIVGKKTVCGLKMPRKLFRDTNNEGWKELPSDRCKNCIRALSKIIFKKRKENWIDNLIADKKRQPWNWKDW